MISGLVKKYRTQRGFTQEEFAQAICERIRGIDLTKQAISNWERGAQTPDYMFLVAVLMAYGDWRHDFAHECLQVLRPEVWAEANPQ
jgi:transcriptional regulator with XRE-family HTH domain